jgi:hypothetical protein
VVLDAHYLSDVIAGAAAGAIGALMVRDWFAARRLGFVVSVDGSFSRLPGPSFARLKKLGRSLLVRLAVADVRFPKARSIGADKKR